MSIRTIILGCAAVVITTGGIFFNKIQTSRQAIYQPRTVVKTLAKGSAGYQEYMHRIRANQITGKIDLAEYHKVKQEVLKISRQHNKAALGMDWKNQGPDNVGGRTRAILVDNSNPNIIYAGSVGGGLYISTDGSNTWKAVAETADNLIISCITQTTSGRIFFGTGSTFEFPGGIIAATPGFVGNGVYEYVPSSGQVLPVLTNTGAVPNNTTTQSLSYINTIAAKGERLYVGYEQGLRVADPDGSGLYPTDVTLWSNPIHTIQGSPTLEQDRVLDIDIASNGSMVVCFKDKVYHSFSDADDSFTKTTIIGDRLSAAIAPSDPNYIYVVSAKVGGNSNPGVTLAGVYLSRSFNGSNLPQFDQVIPGGAAFIDPFLQYGGTGSGQGQWDQCISVDPSNKERCIVGGVQIYEFTLIPSSSPLAGNWTLITHTLTATGGTTYVHADVHTIIWNGNTIYIGGDGGVSKSTDNASTWKTKNLGFNTASFVSVATNDKGWIMGGAQDNGTQLVEYGVLGSTSPLGALEVLGGDGFDSEFSNLGAGIAFATAQYGSLVRTGLTKIAPNTFYSKELELIMDSSSFRTSINYWESENDPLSIDSIKIRFDDQGTAINSTDTIFAGETIFAGDTILYKSATEDLELVYIVPSDIVTTIPMDSFYLQDYIQHKMSLSVDSSGSNQSIYLTREAANISSPSTEWFRVADATSTPDAINGIGYAMAFSPDGNALFVGDDLGFLYRIDNLSMGNDSVSLDVRSGSSVVTCTKIEDFSGRAITGIAVDPNDAENIIITLGNYGNTDYIYRSTTALSAVATGGFSSIQGPAAPGSGYLPRMPIYSAAIDFVNNNTVIIGTEWGAWGSDNAFAASAAAVVWTEENTGLGHVPVFKVRQQTIPNLATSGNYYLGSHGKGFFLSTTLTTGIDDESSPIVKKAKFVSDLTVFPNPLNGGLGNVAFKLQASATTIAKIYNLSGILVRTIDFGYLSSGNHKEQFNASALSVGSYIISIEAGDYRSVSKFIVTQ